MIVTRGLLKKLKEDFGLDKDYDFQHNIYFFGFLTMCKGLD